jgi:predicted RNase H-like HicB family nuclease
MKLRVEYYWDEEAKSWGFTVPALHIVGSAKTRVEAEQEAMEVVKFALEGVEEDFDNDDDVEVGYLDVEVRNPTQIAAEKAS